MLAAGEQRLDRKARGAVQVIEYLRMLEELVVFDHRLEGFTVDEMVIGAVDVTRTHRPRGVRYADRDLLGTLLEQRAHEAGLACPGRGRNGKQAGSVHAIFQVAAYKGDGATYCNDSWSLDQYT